MNHEIANIWLVFNLQKQQFCMAQLNTLRENDNRKPFKVWKLRYASEKAEHVKAIPDSSLLQNNDFAV